MQARINHPAMVVPDAMKTLQALGALTHDGLPEKLLELVHLRASQINGCSACVDMHPRARQGGRRTRRAFLFGRRLAGRPVLHRKGAGRPGADRSLTRLSDRADPVPDDDLGRGRPAIWRAGARGAILAIAISTSGTGSTLPCASRPAPGKCEPGISWHRPIPSPPKERGNGFPRRIVRSSHRFSPISHPAKANCQLRLAC